MLKDKLKTFLARTQQQPAFFDIATGSLSSVERELDIANIGILQEATDDMYSEVISMLRSGNTQNLNSRKFGRVVSSRMRQIISETDSAQIVANIWSHAKDKNKTTLYRNVLVGGLSCTDTDSRVLSDLLYSLRQTPHIFGKRWETRIETYQLLNEPYGQQIVEKLDAADNAEMRLQIEQDSGLRAFRNEGLGTCVYRRWCNRLRLIFESNATDEQYLKHLFRWSEIATENNNLRFSGNDKALGVESMVLPWAKKTPTPALQNAIKSLLISSVGDPRIKPAKWSSIHPECGKIFKRWLAQASFDVFIQVITKVAMVRHWEARNSFWGWYLKEGHIEEIWPIVGSKGVMELQRTIAQAEDGLELEFGRLTGASSDHCVLLMRIGSITIAEWSHNGSARFWLSDNDQAPDLYKQSYTGDRLRLRSNYGIAHSSNWEEKLSKIIDQHTGIAHPTYSNNR